MLRLLSALCFLTLFLTACELGTAPDNEEDFPSFSEDDLDRMMQRQNPAGAMPQQKSLPEMIAQMEASIIQFPEDTTMLYNLAKLNYQQYQADSSEQYLQQAIGYYGRVLAFDPNYEEGRPYYNRMLAQLDQGQYEEALQDLNRFVEVNQDRIPVNHQAMKAEILFQQGKLVAACLVYKEAKLVAERDSLPTGQEVLWTKRCP
ncbi:MAG: tetratricopeptide repeat protein [Aureispira sp.]